MDDYLAGNFKAILDFCQTAEMFQDFPFSMPGTFKYIDRAFPNSKFILTISDTPDQWYHSIQNYHSIIFGRGKPPTKSDLLSADYVYKGWLWKFNRCLYDIPENDPYNKAALIAHYQKYNQEVTDYFRDRPNDFLTLNLSQPGAYQAFCAFLGIDSPYTQFPWENRFSS